MARLDHETQSAVDEHLRRELQRFAHACAAEIRLDVETRALEARSKGASPLESARQKVDAKYLTRREEDWLKSFRFDEIGVMKKTAYHAAILVAVTAVIAIAAITYHRVDPLITSSLLRLLAIIAVPGIIGFLALPAFKYALIKHMGPVACAFADSEVLRNSYGLYIAILIGIVTYFTGSLIALSIMFLFCLNIIPITTNYFRTRRRIKENYAVVSRILRIPGYEEDAM